MKYDRMTIMLHWLTAGLVTATWLLGQGINAFPAPLWEVGVRGMHMAIGMVLILVLAIRIVWRHTAGVSLPASEEGWQGKAAVAMHYVLYAMLTLVLLGGVLNAWARGVSVFGLFEVTSFIPGNRATQRLISDVHALGANAVLILAGAHAAMALAHHYILRDGVLRRMLPET